jgi:phosphotransferase system enzyme I (PtsI)
MKKLLKGIPASPGLSLGRVVRVQKVGPSACGRSITPDEVAREVARWDEASDAAVRQMEKLQKDMADKLSESEAGIFGAQAMMLSDPTLAEEIHRIITDELVSAEQATLEACEEHARALESLDDPYLSARAQDMRDIGLTLVKHLQGPEDAALRDQITFEDAVLFADDLMPSETASLDPTKVSAIVLEKGGSTSHTAILARSFGIPAVVGVGQVLDSVQTGDLAIVDGDQGVVTVNPSDQEIPEFRVRAAAAEERRRQMEMLRDLPAVTKDGRRIEVAANIGSVEEARLARNFGAQGVGLFRTEFLFLDRDSMPTEEKQYEVYSKVLSDLKPHPVIIRTLDAGGDKEIPYLHMPHEDNPFLGLRAIRLCLKETAIFRTQLRALLRASVHGRLRIMFPMVACLQELRAAKREMKAVRKELEDEGIRVAENISVGIMVETPSAALEAGQLAKECDFFSIGTNDLTQYTMAADRGNASVGYLNDPFHPAVLRLIGHTIDKGHQQGIWVGMCGEMAGNPLAIPLLVAMGIDELSMAPAAIPRAKEIVRSLDSTRLDALSLSVKQMTTNDEVRAWLGCV